MDLVLTTRVHKGLEIYRKTPGALLIDVRTPEEYSEGHIPGSINLPLNIIEDEITDIAPDMDTSLFLYCLNGNRSIQGASALQDFGYENAASIGGIESYRGPIEKE